MEQEIEQVVMELIMNGGDARSLSLKAIQSAENGDIKMANDLLEQSSISINKAHEAQAYLIRKEVKGRKVPLNLLIVHAQDHVMNAMTVRDLAQHIIKTQKEIHKLKALTKGGVK